MLLQHPHHVHLWVSSCQVRTLRFGPTANNLNVLEAPSSTNISIMLFQNPHHVHFWVRCYNFFILLFFSFLYFYNCFFFVYNSKNEVWIWNSMWSIQTLTIKLTLVVLSYHSNFHFFSLVPLFKIFVVYLVKFMVVVTFWVWRNVLFALFFE